MVEFRRRGFTNLENAMLEFEDFLKSGEKVLEAAIAVNVSIAIWATVGIAFWTYQVCCLPPKK